MNLRATCYAFIAVATLAATALLLPVQGAMAGNSRDTDIEPPAPIYEVNPGDRPGYIWSDGSWQWDGQRHRWHPGYWVPERPGYAWIPDHWAKRGKLWHYTKGHWEADDKSDADARPQEESVAADAPPPAPADTTAATATPSKSHKPVHRKPVHPAVNYNDPSMWPFHKRDD